jgi:hypothetical protein
LDNLKISYLKKIKKIMNLVNKDEINIEICENFKNFANIKKIAEEEENEIYLTEKSTIVKVGGYFCIQFFLFSLFFYLIFF